MIAWKVWLSGMAFACVHSLLASDMCKRVALQHRIDSQHYRLAYTVLAVVATIIWLGYVHSLPDARLYAIEGGWRWCLIGMQGAGLAIVLASFCAFDAKVFLGFAPAPDGCEPFHESGIYRWMRHPMYMGFMLMLLASPEQTVNSLNLALFVSVYFIVGSRLEERRMLNAHPEYAEYCKRVGVFFPCRKKFSMN